jgi:hypothetical protein
MIIDVLVEFFWRLFNIEYKIRQRDRFMSEANLWQNEDLSLNNFFVITRFPSKVSNDLILL